MYAYTLTNLLLSIRTLLAELTASFWTDAQLTIYINNAVNIISDYANCYRSITNYSTAILTRTITITGEKCLAVEYNGQFLRKVNIVSLGHLKLDGVYPQYWFENGSTIGIEPVPAEVYTLTVYETTTPVALSSSGSIPSIPYDFCGLIIYFVLAMAMKQDRKNSVSLHYIGMFYNELDFMSKSVTLELPDAYADIRKQ